MQGCFQSKYSNISPSFAEGLHFSAFHYLGIDFPSNRARDTCIRKLLGNGI